MNVNFLNFKAILKPLIIHSFIPYLLDIPETLETTGVTTIPGFYSTF